MTTTVLFLCKDVFFWPVVKDAVGQYPDARLLIVRTIEDPQLKQLSSGDDACCLIDLASLEVSQVAAAVDQLRQILGAEIRIVAFGPHVQEARLNAARQAGCSPVLSRSQFHSKLPDLLKGWLDEVAARDKC